MAIIGKDIQKAAELLRQGELVAIPTETVYGLAANGLKGETIDKIYAAKNRPSNNPLILHIPSIDRIKGLVNEVPEIAIKLATEFWPGPLTMVLPKNIKVPDKATGGLNSVAIRMPAHDLTLELLSLLDFPLAAPSANLSNRISPTSPEHVNSQLGDKIPYILDGGRCRDGIESTIVGFEGEIPVILRHGALSINQLKTVCREVLTKKEHGEILAPGMFLKHYSPQTKMIVTTNIQEVLKVISVQNIGILTFSEVDNQYFGNYYTTSLSKNGSMSEAAYNLYEKLHQLDKMNFDCIIAEYAPNSGLGISINDRLKRASS